MNEFTELAIPAVSIISLALSIISIYLAHIRGPKISLVIPKKPYPITNTRDDKSTFHHVITVTFLIANTGIRSGILNQLDISSKDRIFSSASINPLIIKELPKILQPGEGLNLTYDIVFKLNSEIEWREYLAKRKNFEIEVIYSHTTTFNPRKTSKQKIIFDIDYIKNIYTLSQ